MRMDEPVDRAGCRTDARMPEKARQVPPAPRTSLGELALLFLRLGATVFGGPAAHIAVMQDEVVRRRKWLGADRFLDLLGATNLIPGPNSTEMAIHIGYERRGWPGLVVAGTCFILPAVILTGALAWAYVRFGTLPQLGWVLYGVKPAILAVVVQAIWGLAPRAARTWRLRVLGVLAAVAVLLGVHELAVLLGAGVASIAWSEHGRPGSRGAMRPTGAAAILASNVPAAVGAAVSLAGIFGVFLKAGALLFGSGYVLLAFLRADLVERLHWLTEAELIDAIAVGQVTPGPIFSTATFVGFVLAGPAGAVAATLGIFLPAFLFVAASGPLVPRLRASRSAAAFLDGVNVASLALIAVVLLQLLRAAIVDVPTAVLAVTSAALLVRFGIHTTWLVLGAAAAGLLVHVGGFGR